MRLTIIRDMGLVHVDGRGHNELNMAVVPANVHAVQWDGTVGEIEYISNEVPNEVITALPAWAEQLGNERAAVIAAEEAAEEQARLNAEAYANSAEGKVEALRAERNRLIAETDWWALSDLTMTQTQIDYRQALRDITETYLSLDDAIFPEKPEYSPR